jgi:hypothetical protein
MADSIVQYREFFALLLDKNFSFGFLKGMYQRRGFAAMND